MLLSYLRGIVHEKSSQSVVIEVGGIGYELSVSERSASALPEIGRETLIYTYLSVSESDISLFGFASRAEESVFTGLIGVSGVGPRTALSALSQYGPDELMYHIASGDAAALSKISGIGKKTAARIILDLKDAFGLALESGPVPGAGSSLRRDSEAARNVEEALISMGFSSEEAGLALEGADTQADDAELLRYALKRLGS